MIKFAAEIFKGHDRGQFNHGGRVWKFLLELGKEVSIELMRLGCEVIAVDRYANAPAMQVTHRSHVIDMLDGAAIRGVVEQERPHFIVPEIEAIASPASLARRASSDSSGRRRAPRR